MKKLNWENKISFIQRNDYKINVYSLVANTFCGIILFKTQSIIGSLIKTKHGWSFRIFTGVNTTDLCAGTLEQIVNKLKELNNEK